MKTVVKVSLLFLLFGCISTSPWSVQHLKTGNPIFDAAKLTYHPPEKARGMKLEFHKNESGLKLFIYTLEHLPLSKNKEVSILVFFQNEQKEFKGSLFEGGQRILASQDLQDMLLTALKKGEKVVLKCSGYATTVFPEDFQQSFSKLFSAPLALPVQFGLE